MKQTILGANGTIGKLLAKELMTYTNQIRLVSRNPKKVNETDELFPVALSNPEMVYAFVGMRRSFSSQVYQQPASTNNK